MDHIGQNLSAYVDGELEGPMLAAAERHLASCAECRGDLEALKRIVRRAGSLDDRMPETDLWAGIQQRIATPGSEDVIPIATRRRKLTFTMPQLAAAALVLVGLTAGAVTLAQRGWPSAVSGQPSAGQPSAITRAVSNESPADLTVASYDSAIRGMQAMLQTRRSQLDTGTIRVVEQSLTVIDAAIKQARDALAHDPSNLYLNGQLQRTLDRKLDVLRQVVTLPTARS